MRCAQQDIRSSLTRVTESQVIIVKVLFIQRVGSLRSCYLRHRRHGRRTLH